MKRLQLFIFTITLLLFQWGTLDHQYHDHDMGEVCDYCISAKSLNDAVSNSVQTIVLNKHIQNPEVLLTSATFTTVSQYYAVRAPPRFS